jgi:non-canonical poly(A) RNA polymerase PAPD5/7
MGNEYASNKTTLCLHRELLDFAEWMLPTREERHLRYLVIQRFKNSVKQLWPNAVTICHGSSATHTYLPTGDIDLVIHRQMDSTPAESLLEELNTYLNSLQIFRSSEVIQSARCPIIKGIEKPFGFHVDIAINNENGILNIHRNKRIMETYPSLLPLLMFFKFFLYQNRLDEPFRGGISTNTLQNMIVFIIQSADPPLEQRNLGKMMVAFFKTFGTTFNYITTGISVRSGGRLFSRLENDRVNWKTPVCLCVEDPQLPGQFLGENCYQCLTFRTKCHQAHQRLMRGGVRDEQSLLLRVIQRPDIILKRRAELSKQYQSLLGNAVESFALSNKEEGREYSRPYGNNKGRWDKNHRNFDDRERRPWNR